MEPLDLRIAPPRAPRDEAAGFIFLPRSIDKFRASLPGGHLGEYKIDGHTASLLEMLDTTPADAIEIVARAATETEVVAELLRDVRHDTAAKWNAIVTARKPRNGDRAAAIESYPWLADRPDLILSLDVLAEDDRISFGR